MYFKLLLLLIKITIQLTYCLHFTLAFYKLKYSIYFKIKHFLYILGILLPLIKLLFL